MCIPVKLAFDARRARALPREDTDAIKSACDGVSEMVEFELSISLDVSVIAVSASATAFISSMWNLYISNGNRMKPNHPR